MERLKRTVQQSVFIGFGFVRQDSFWVYLRRLTGDRLKDTRCRKISASKGHKPESSSRSQRTRSQRTRSGGGETRSKRVVERPDASKTGHRGRKPSVSPPRRMRPRQRTGRQAEGDNWREMQRYKGKRWVEWWHVCGHTNVALEHWVKRGSMVIWI